MWKNEKDSSISPAIVSEFDDAHTLANKMATSRTDFIHDLCRGSTLDAGGGPQRKNSGKFSILDGPPIKEREEAMLYTSSKRGKQN